MLSLSIPCARRKVAFSVGVDEFKELQFPVALVFKVLGFLEVLGLPGEEVAWMLP